MDGAMNSTGVAPVVFNVNISIRNPFLKCLKKMVDICVNLVAFSQAFDINEHYLVNWNFE